MKDFLQFAFLGLGAGAAYAMLAQGIVLIYRGSGVVNFAHGALAMIASYFCFVTLRVDEGWPLVPSLIGGVLLAALVGFLFQFLALRHLQQAAPIVRLVSTLGLLVMVQSLVENHYGPDFLPVDLYLPHHVYDVGGVAIQQDRIILLCIAIVLTVALWAFTRFHKLGLAITASAENERAVASLGWSPNSLSAFTWSVGGGLAGLAGVLAAPLTGLTPATFTLVVTVSALAAALLGGFRSFPLTLAGGLVLGVGSSLMTRYQDDVRGWLGLHSLVGAASALPFLVIVVVLVVRGRGLPLRSHVSDRLPSLGTGIVRYPAFLIGIASTAVLSLYVLDTRWATAVFVTLIAATFILSIVVLTGFAGQLSLAQYAIGGIGALVAAKLVAEEGWPTELAFLAGIVGAIVIGLLFAIPALRTRGVNLAVVTLGLGFAVSAVIFSNSDYVATRTLDNGTNIGSTTLFWVDVNAIDHPERWAVVCLVGFSLVVVLVANLRRSRTGRRLIAVRTNERAAASLGISVFGAKLYAFAVAAAIAAVAGVLLGFQTSLVTYTQYNAFASINAVAQAVIGGIGWVLGSIFGATLAAGSVGSVVLEDWINLGEWLTFIGGAVLIILLLVHPDGIADGTCRALRNARGWVRAARVRPAEVEPLPEPVLERVPPKALEIEGLTVAFGGVTAVEDAGLSVAPGEIVGLIGPNGAGKTTIIDAVTGFVKASAGEVRLGGESLSGKSATWRARRGLRRSFQSLELFEDVTVAENIHTGADRASRLSWLSDLVHPGKHPLPSTAVAAVRCFDLEEHLRQRPRELPYGRRRLVGIARAMASGPSVLMLDEPAAGLDSTESGELATLIRGLAKERGMAVLLVEHDVGLVMSVCDRVVVLDFGRVIASGTPDEVRSDPAVLAAYLGELSETGTGIAEPEVVQ